MAAPSEVDSVITEGYNVDSQRDGFATGLAKCICTTAPFLKNLSIKKGKLNASL
jgi:hypothetical protein